METFRVTGTLWREPPVTCGFPSQKSMARSFDVFFDLRLNKRLSKGSRRRWFETPSRPLWRNCNEQKRVLFSIISICLCRLKVDKRSEMQIHYFITSHKFSRSLLLWFMDSGDANGYIIYRSCFCCPGSKYIYTWTSVKCREILLFSFINSFPPSAAYICESAQHWFR